MKRADRRVSAKRGVSYTPAGAPGKAAGGLRKRVRALVIVTLFCGLLGGGLLLRVAFSGGEGVPPRPRSAAIVDQLSLTQPNAIFIHAATELLERGGYAVDYFPGEQVTVDLYRNLPTMGYDLILLRVHSGLTREIDSDTGTMNNTEYVSLFSGEPYSETKYRDEEAAGRVGKAFYYKGASPLFGITPDFVQYTMRGRFAGTLIVMMGCDGLRSQRTAQAFLEKGASAFVSWSRPVSPNHTDSATQRLLEKLLLDGLTVADAVSETAVEVGPDPFYGAELRILPDDR